MEMEQIDLDYVDLLASQLINSRLTGEQLVHINVEKLGQTLQYLCAISNTKATIDLVKRLVEAMEENTPRLEQIHKALLTTIEVRRDLNSLEIAVK